MAAQIYSGSEQDWLRFVDDVAMLYGEIESIGDIEEFSASNVCLKVSKEEHNTTNSASRLK
jgi:hypothetical protein